MKVILCTNDSIDTGIFIYISNVCNQRLIAGLRRTF
ncbi:unnamed protein product [Staurois parvus]|uniref:Uncharacterized protein n=1 Tax=Staurois parvus TaxID=386267 RepID=A0ABN9DE46_9NEOB|nr:unnamed protein product [Staurois parvus]